MAVPKKAVLIIFAMLITIPVLFFSCSAGITGTIRGGGTAEISVQASLGPRTLVLMKSLKSFIGDESSAPMLDGRIIGGSLAASPGIRSASLRNTSPSALEGTISVSDLGNFLATGEGKFITFKDGPSNSSILVVLDRNSAPLLISALSPEVEEYLSALMAPVVTGESINKREYLDIIASVYGRPLSDEIVAARIKAQIEFPRQPMAILGGNAVTSGQGRRAEFDIPLLDILVLEQPLRYEVSW